MRLEPAPTPCFRGLEPFHPGPGALPAPSGIERPAADRHAYGVPSHGEAGGRELLGPKFPGFGGPGAISLRDRTIGGSRGEGFPRAPSNPLRHPLHFEQVW